MSLFLNCDDAYPHPMSLQNYLNYVGVLHHIFPCNVVYSDNATDPIGGNNAKTAIKNLAEFYKKPKSHDLIRDIDSIIDKKAIKMIFQKGFDDNNILCLAFIILQIHDLLAIRTSSENYRYSISKYKEMQEMVLKTASFIMLPPRIVIINFCLKAIKTIKTRKISKKNLIKLLVVP